MGRVAPMRAEMYVSQGQEQDAGPNAMESREARARTAAHGADLSRRSSINDLQPPGGDGQAAGGSFMYKTMTAPASSSLRGAAAGRGREPGLGGTTGHADTVEARQDQAKQRGADAQDCLWTRNQMMGRSCHSLRQAAGALRNKRAPRAHAKSQAKKESSASYQATKRRLQTYEKQCKQDLQL